MNAPRFKTPADECDNPGLAQSIIILQPASQAGRPAAKFALTLDLHIDPIHRDIQPGGELWSAEQGYLMGPPGARLGHPDSGAAPDLPDRDRQDHALAAWGSMTVAGEGCGDFVIRHAIAGEIEHTITHFRPSRELEDGVDLHLDLEVGYCATPPDDPDLSDIMLTAVEYNFVNKTSQ